MSYDMGEAEMASLQRELKRTMELYSTVCKEALTEKQKLMEDGHGKVEEGRKDIVLDIVFACNEAEAETMGKDELTEAYHEDIERLSSLLNEKEEEMQAMESLFKLNMQAMNKKDMQMQELEIALAEKGIEINSMKEDLRGKLKEIAQKEKLMETQAEEFERKIVETQEELKWKDLKLEKYHKGINANVLWLALVICVVFMYFTMNRIH